MAQPLLIQGTWEELSVRAEEFKDRRDLMLIVPGDPDVKNSALKEGVSLAEALKGRTGIVSFEPTNLSENMGRKFTDLLVEKHQKEQQ